MLTVKKCEKSKKGSYNFKGVALFKLSRISCITSIILHKIAHTFTYLVFNFFSFSELAKEKDNHV